MRFSRLAIAVVAVSGSLIAQTPQRSGFAYLCESRPTYENPFPRSVVLKQQSTSLLQNGIDLTKIIPPPEFQRHGLTVIHLREASQQPSLWPIEGCQLIHIDEKDRIH